MTPNGLKNPFFEGGGALYIFLLLGKIENHLHKLPVSASNVLSFGEVMVFPTVYFVTHNLS